MKREKTLAYAFSNQVSYSSISFIEKKVFDSVSGLETKLSMSLINMILITLS